MLVKKARLNFLSLFCQVTRAMLLWVNNHYGDFEGDPVMEGYLETFEKGLELQVSTDHSSYHFFSLLSYVLRVVWVG